MKYVESSIYTTIYTKHYLNSEKAQWIIVGKVTRAYEG